jgi:hypothetical protein
VPLSSCSTPLPRSRETEIPKESKRDTIEEIRGHTSQGDWADCHMHPSALKDERDEFARQEYLTLGLARLRVAAFQYSTLNGSLQSAEAG